MRTFLSTVLTLFLNFPVLADLAPSIPSPLANRVVLNSEYHSPSSYEGAQIIQVVGEGLNFQPLPKFRSGRWQAEYRWDQKEWTILAFDMADYDSTLDQRGQRALFARFEKEDGSVVASLPTLGQGSNTPLMINGIRFPGTKFGFPQFKWHDPYFTYQGQFEGKTIEARFRFLEDSKSLRFSRAVRSIQAAPQNINGIVFFHPPQSMVSAASFIYFGSQKVPEFITSTSLYKVPKKGRSWIETQSLYETAVFEPNFPLDRVPPTILIVTPLNGSKDIELDWAFFTKLQKLPGDKLLYWLSNAETNTHIVFSEPEND